MKTGFKKISIDKYIELHLKSNPGTKRKEITEGLKRALEAYKKGIKCRCGNAIWVIGSTVCCWKCMLYLYHR